MRPHEIDFEAMLPFLDDWRALSPETRMAWIGCQPSHPLREDAFGVEADRLLEANLLDPRPGGGFLVSRAARSLHRFLRAADRCRSIQDPARIPYALRTYVQEALDPDDRAAVYGKDGPRYDDVAGLLARRVQSSTWVGSFFEAEDPADWERAHRAPYGGGRGPKRALLSPQVGRALAACLTEIRDSGGRLRIEDLLGDLSTRKRASRSRALAAALHYILLFPYLDTADPVPTIAMAPGVAARLTRPVARRPRATDEPVGATPPFLLTDMTVLLVRMAAGNVRVKASDGALFKKSKDELQGALTPLDPRLAQWVRTDAPLRLQEARATLASLDFCCVEEAARNRLTLRPTAKGRAWLAAPEKERRRQVLDLLRQASDPHDAPRLRLLSYGRAAALAPAVAYHRALELANEEVLLAQIRRALSGLPSKGGVPLPAWLRWQAETQNPLLGAERTGSGGRIRRGHWDWVSPEHLERVWREVLISAIARRLVPLGGVALAPSLDDGEEPRIGLTSAGCYLLAAADDFDVEDAAAPEARIVVQPNYDVVFLAPSPHHEAQLAPLAERVGQDVGTLFHLTRDAVLGAAAAGLTAEEGLARLKQASGEPLPANVERSIRSWFARVRRVRGQEIWVVRCPDEETASRVESAAGKNAERLGPTAVTVSSRATLVRLRQRLAKDGLLLDLEEDEVER